MAALQLAFFLAPTLLVSGAQASRPRILGISHVALHVSDMARSRSFYEDFLGYSAVSAVSAKGGSRRLLLAVNDRQYVELRAGLRPEQDRLDHIALETDDVLGMRRYLASRGVAVPEAVARDASGSRAFTLRDPEGRGVELMQHDKGGWPRRAKPADGTPVSRRILHAGVLVGDLPAAQGFYGGLLGLTEIWRGSRSGSELSWTNMQVPDGQDYVELMLYGALPAPDARGTQHHICLEVSDIEQAKARLLERPYARSYARPLEIRVGTNRKRQLNLYDPDGTRVELMEPFTVDGQPVPSSTAPPPRPTR